MNIFKYFLSLYREKSQVVLLTWAYSAVAIIFILISGICALISQNVGVALLIIPLVSVTALCLNVTVWALIRFGIESVELRQRSKRNAKKKSSEKSKKSSKSAKKSEK